MSLTVGLDPNRIDTAAEFGLGFYGVEAGAHYVYVRIAGAVAQKGEVMAIDADHDAYPLTTTTDLEGRSVGVAPGVAAVGTYCWLFVRGNTEFLVAGDCAANSRLYATATGGVVDDTGTGPIIAGMIAAEAAGSMQERVKGLLGYPFMLTDSGGTSSGLTESEVDTRVTHLRPNTVHTADSDSALNGLTFRKGDTVLITGNIGSGITANLVEDSGGNALTSVAVPDILQAKSDTVLTRIYTQPFTVVGDVSGVDAGTGISVQDASTETPEVNLDIDKLTAVTEVQATVTGDFALEVIADPTGTPVTILTADVVAGAAFKIIEYYSNTGVTDYRFQYRVANTNATLRQLNFDDLRVSPNSGLIAGPVVTNYVDAGAMAITAVTTDPTPTNVTVSRVQYARVGQLARLSYNYEKANGGGGGSGDYLYALPDGLSFDSSVTLETGNTKAEAVAASIGSGRVQSGSSIRRLDVVPYDATRFRIYASAQETTGGFVSNSNFALDQNQTFNVHFEAPILGWQPSSNVVPASGQYDWFERFAGSAVQVAGTNPTKEGEYRALYKGASTTTTTIAIWASSVLTSFISTAAACTIIRSASAIATIISLRW